ncbi:1-acyl-sn-glycerol-3-phosphate acyltransferase [Paucilactobacillus hokkaidonensis]|nr:1-acyl-sn-glycerol-3-phosphate acyltransferase [Paucilactobacillus hokkaidonensis]
MLLGDDRDSVIANIKKAANEGRFNDKVENGDPVLSVEQQDLVLTNYLKKHDGLAYKFNNLISRVTVNSALKFITRTVKIEGLDNIKAVTSGAIVTSNHFSPLDTAYVHKAVVKAGKSRLYIVSELENLKMQGLLGYIMNYYDTMPISTNANYMGREFPELVKNILDRDQFVLIYPEQEMWFNYRKPRPPKRGAYYYAAKFKVPIISCFVEMQNQAKVKDSEFGDVAIIIHILNPIYPDPHKSEHENSILLMNQDYAQKSTAYEKVYNKKLDYKFADADIAGWYPPEHLDN